MLYKIVVGAWLVCAILTTTSYVLYGGAMADRAVGALIAWAFIIGVLLTIKYIADEDRAMAERKDEPRLD